jgi:hypothetical protein
MATHALLAPRILADDDVVATLPVRPRGRSLMRRFSDALIESQTRRAEREVDRVLGRGTFARAMRGELPPQR